METWEKLPLGTMDDIAELETYNRVYYRPVYAIHKWFAPRPGSTFRILSLAALTNDKTTRNDILTTNDTNTKYIGKYLESNNFEGATILDPFAGGGTTLVEANRVGADVIGYELNPVAWWINKKIKDDVDVTKLRQASSELVEETRSDLSKYFTTTDPDTGSEAEVLYTFQTQILPCLTCGEEVHLFKNYMLANFKKNKTTDNVPGSVYCPNSDCDDRIIQTTEKVSDELTCPSCNTTFDPKSGNARNYGGTVKYTCKNGHKHDVRETLDRLDEKPKFEYYAIQYLTKSGNKKFKEFTEEDQQTVKAVEERLNNESEDLPIPTQEIIPGDKTSRLTTRNYESYRDLFTDRQLLTYGTLFQNALEFDNENIAEFLITGVSNSLKRNSMLAKWNYHENHKKAENVFARKSYIPRVATVEPNPINTIDNVTSVGNFLGFVADAKEYCQNPFEMVKEDGDTEKYPIQNERISEGSVRSLKCKTSENIELEDGEVDYVITDPPYYDNIQYSELSEYFYVWLQQVLGDRYDEMAPDHVPSAREIVKNDRTGKDSEFFVKTLANVFSESHRVLKDDGELIFTYHHSNNKAWAVILEAVIESGFTITGAYPVQSEMPGSMTVKELDNAEYDILIFANKENTDEDITLEELRQDLYFELQDMIAEEQERHENLSTADLGVILRGKSMYYYSKHYPDVYTDGEQVGIEEVLDTVDSVIEQALERTVNLPQSIDPITQAYAAFCQRGGEDYDDLNKHLLAKNLNVSDLEDEKLVKGPRNKKKPMTADERINYIEGKLNSNGDNGHALLDIDRVQYLYHLYKTDQNTTEYLKEWKSDDLEDLAEFMADVSGDERYENVMDMTLQQF
ncbi:DUF1156 domain-containing protein [Halobaculum sp. MBLA0147]|uniref:DUF1156 domain-containing protein n=1 Tax=Halobaculum sp. MBLA0147 TaxID=3079934 RepID=UPI0035263476